MKPILTFSEGHCLIAADLHGHLPDFERVIFQYKRLRSEFPSLKLLFLGDLIHNYDYKRDQSIEILHRLMEMGCNDPDGTIFALMGNHEFAHIYHLQLLKARFDFTKGFEWKIARERQLYTSFFEQMPLVAVTHSGVLIHHTGASPCFNEDNLKEMGLDDNFFVTLNHRMLKYALGFDLMVDFKLNAQVGNRLMSHPEGEVLWECFMNGNELQYGDQYETYLKTMLQYYQKHSGQDNIDYLVTGHLGVDSGVEVVVDKQLRLCTSQGCSDDLQKKLLLVDCQNPIENMKQLLDGIIDLY